MPLGGLTASNASIQNRAAELKRIIRSMQVARRMLLQAKEKSVDFIVRAIKVDRQTAEDSYEDYRKTSSGSGVPSREGMEQIVKSLQLLGQFTGKKVAFEEIADARIAREVARSWVTKWTSKLLKKPHMLRCARPISRQRTEYASAHRSSRAPRL